MSAAPDLEKDFLSPGFTLSKAPGPIGGPGAWLGPDMTSRREEWTYTLSDSDIGELDDAMCRTREKAFVDIDKAAESVEPGAERARVRAAVARFGPVGNQIRTLGGEGLRSNPRRAGGRLYLGGVGPRLLGDRHASRHSEIAECKGAPARSRL